MRVFKSLFQKKSSRPKWAMYKHELEKIRNACLFVISEFCITVCSASTAYTRLCRGLKYLLKVPYIITNYPNVVGFLIFETLCLGSLKILPYV